ncbi:MAG: GerMN domain-containing protein [Actinobacteria bacterium]|nr:GerMN domain-containing protein [Actinomycetota bacterium]
MKRTITLLLIVALVSLLTVLATGCEDEAKKSAPVSEAQKYNVATDAQESAATESGADAGKAIAGAKSAKAVDITVYFSDDQSEYLVSETRHIADTENLAISAMEELIKGPTESGHYATIPSETSILGIDINDRIAYVSFSKELIDKHWGGSSGELMTITSIVNTLTEFDDIQKVQILVDGKTVETIAGHSDVSRPLARDDTKIK